MTDQIGSSEPRAWERLLLVLVLLVSCGYLGYLAGLVVGVLWFRFAATSLVDIFFVLKAGKVGAAAGLALGGILSWKARYGLLRKAAITAAGLAVLMLALHVLWRPAAGLMRQDEAGLDVPLPPPAGFRIDARIVHPGQPEAWLAIDGKSWEATWTKRGSTTGICTEKLTFKEARALLLMRTQIRNAPDHLRALCRVAKEDASHVYVLQESAPGAPPWVLFSASRCLREHPEIQRLHRIVWQVGSNALHDGRCG